MAIVEYYGSYQHRNGSEDAPCQLSGVGFLQVWQSAHSSRESVDYAARGLHEAGSAGVCSHPQAASGVDEVGDGDQRNITSLEE